MVPRSAASRGRPPTVRAVRWIVHGEREIYDSPWVRLTLADVEIPGINRFEHHVVRMPHQAAGVIVHDPERGVLLLWRHRFITDTWGWEIPAGRVEAGESVEEGGRREALEETGWRVGSITPVVTYHPMNGICDQAFHILLATDAVHVGDPTDPSESERVEWVATADLKDAITRGDVPDGFTLIALTYALLFGALD